MPTPKKKATTTNSRSTPSTRRNMPAAPPQDTSLATGAGNSGPATGLNRSQEDMEERLEKQREVGAKLTEQAAKRAGVESPDGVFTAVSRNGLSHRRNGIIFGNEPVTVDTSEWTEVEKQRFFNDNVLMIVEGKQLKARGALLAPVPGARLGGTAGENETPAMRAAAEAGRVQRHPASAPGGGPVGAGANVAARDLERSVNRTATGPGEREPGDDGGGE